MAKNRPSGALWVWSVAGFALVSLFANNGIRWIRSPDFVRPDPGPDPYPYLYVLRATEAISIVVFLFIGNHVLLRPWVANRHPSLDGKMFIGGFFASTLDILFAVFNPTWAMNAYGFSYGSWSNSIPGWPSPGAHEIPYVILFNASRTPDLHTVTPNQKGEYLHHCIKQANNNQERTPQR